MLEKLRMSVSVLGKKVLINNPRPLQWSIIVVARVFYFTSSCFQMITKFTIPRVISKRTLFLAHFDSHFLYVPFHLFYSSYCTLSLFNSHVCNIYSISYFFANNVHQYEQYSSADIFQISMISKQRLQTQQSRYFHLRTPQPKKT